MIKFPNYCNPVLLAFIAIFLVACGGDQPPPDNNGKPDTTKDSSQVSNGGTEVKTVKASIEEIDMETLFDGKIVLTENGMVLKGSAKPEDGVPTYEITSASDFEEFSAHQVELKNAVEDCWGARDVISEIFYHADSETKIGDRHIIAQTKLTETEVKYYRIWFILNLKEYSPTVEEAYKKIHTKLNRICQECEPLTEKQIEMLKAELKEDPNYGIFDALTTHQMASYDGI